MKLQYENNDEDHKLFLQYAIDDFNQINKIMEFNVENQKIDLFKMNHMN